MTQVTVDHPLAPLTADEVSRATEVLRREGRLQETVRVHGMLLREPSKEEVFSHQPGAEVDRQVLVVLRDRAEKTGETR